MSETQTPKQVDTTLAALYGEKAKLNADIDRQRQYLRRYVGGKQVRQGGRNVWTLTLAEAEVKARNGEYVAEFYERVETLAAKGAEHLAKLDALRDELGSVQQVIEEQDALYTGWSRFFLVTSSAGHVHSSLNCSTCYPSTGYGWLPELSGESEADAVAALGSRLCSVCFPSAPVDATGGTFTQAQAEKIAKEGLSAAKALLAKEAAKTASCKGSGSYLNRDLPHRTGYAYGNWATCEHCGQHAALTSTNKLRKH